MLGEIYVWLFFSTSFNNISFSPSKYIFTQKIIIFLRNITERSSFKISEFQVL